jgi:hypothetical protein
MPRPLRPIAGADRGIRTNFDTMGRSNKPPAWLNQSFLLCRPATAAWPKESSCNPPFVLLSIRLTTDAPGDVSELPSAARRLCSLKSQIVPVCSACQRNLYAEPRTPTSRAEPTAGSFHTRPQENPFTSRQNSSPASHSFPSQLCPRFPRKQLAHPISALQNDLPRPATN